MNDPAPSYMHGASDQPMIGDTIGANFDRNAARYANRPGLIVHQQGINWTWSELAARVEAFAAGLIALGLQPGDPHRHLVTEQRRVDRHPIRHRQGRTDPGQHQPRLPLDRGRIRAEQSRLQGADHRDQIQDERLYRDDQHTRT